MAARIPQQKQRFSSNRNFLWRARGAHRGWPRWFSDLRVRPKLMVLHNIFFVLVGSTVYFTLIPVFEKTVADAEMREVNLVTPILFSPAPQDLQPGTATYDFREGTAARLEIPKTVLSWLYDHPGQVWQDPQRSDFLYRKDANSGLYRRVRIPHRAYRQVIGRAKLSLFLALGGIYIAAILVLEYLIMPHYVYRPLRLMLNADAATQLGDGENELIDPKLIGYDEIGQIMHSRNVTVRELRRQEDYLAAALKRLEETAADLQQKNDLLERAKQNLADQDRLVSLGLLSASVAHELNTPLAVLHGSIEKLLETVPERPAQDRLSRMLRVTQRLRKISESLLDFARVRTQETEDVDLHALIEEAWTLVGIDEKAGEVQFADYTTSADRLQGNFDRLIQVFVNLLRNALCAIKTHGHVSVCASAIEQGGRPFLRITVDDDGPGIPPEVLPNLFEAFVSTRLDSRGTGLGLTVAEGIVHQHGGTIQASNRPEGGARLEVTLPAAAVAVSV